ncbi:glycosyltransferase family 2 protein [Granulicella arctica]|uniref:GT2 family glycosyltransferase n=1 Tax=Granulicella arctica TaxID=940613 RepID=A0A7Y9TGI2_9BACT|nr:glycosyltransferase family A protein [Granulicella arctica]NYF79931.1 GT2 family glycosyltransferase [Granulicella arctica]
MIHEEAKLANSSLEAQTRLRLVLAIATRGRPAILADTLAALEFQTRKPDALLIAYPEPQDVEGIASRFPQARLLLSQPGLTRQRNTILNALPTTDLLVFLDDDFHIHRDYLAVMEQLFLAHPEVVVATGTLLGDGIHGAALNPADASTLFRSCQTDGTPLAISPVFNAYGCNMVFRMEPIERHGIRFDESLPLYGWYEDVDFSRRLSRHGRAVRVDQAWGVHLGVKSGRHSEVRLGYSQVANPIYLARKRSVPWSFAVASVASRSLKNLVRSIAPESHIDRRGRLRGNIRAFRDLSNGSLSPTRVSSM